MAADQLSLKSDDEAVVETGRGEGTGRD